MITCKQCGKLKNEADYYKRQGSKCKECIKDNARLYKAKNKEKKGKKDAAKKKTKKKAAAKKKAKK